MDLLCSKEKLLKEKSCVVWGHKFLFFDQKMALPHVHVLCILPNHHYIIPNVITCGIDKKYK